MFSIFTTVIYRVAGFETEHYEYTKHFLEVSHVELPRGIACQAFMPSVLKYPKLFRS